MRLTNPLWYLAALVLVIGSAVAGTAVAATAFDTSRQATVTTTSERANAAGKALAVYTNDEEHGAIACHGKDRKKNRIDIPEKSVGVTTKTDGATWYLLAILPDGRDDLKITCAPSDDRPDTASYAWAAVSGYSSAASNGRLIAIAGAGLGLLLGGFVFWSRRPS